MGNLTSTLTIHLDEDLTKRAPAAAAALKALGGAGNDLAKLAGASPAVAGLTKQIDALTARAGKLTEFRAAGEGLKAFHAGLRTARDEVGRLDKVIAAKRQKLKDFAEYKADFPAEFEKRFGKTGIASGVEKQLKAAEKDRKAADRRMTSATQAFEGQRDAVRGLRRELIGADAPLSKLVGMEAQLKARIAQTNAERERQIGLIRQGHEAQTRAAAAEVASAKARGEASSAALRATVEAGRASRVAHDHAARQEAARKASASGDLLRGMGGVGRQTADHIDQGRRLTDGMGASGRASAERRAATAQAAIEARAKRREERVEAAKTIGAGVSIVAQHKATAYAKGSIEAAAEFDFAVRRQRVSTDISGGAQAGLMKQAQQIGQETQFSNIDVVKAQTTAMQGLPASFAPDLKAVVAEGIVANVRNYATLMETDLKDGTETIRGYLQQAGKNISTKEKALFEANKATNQLFKMAKLGGMDGEDVKNFSNYAIASAAASGLSTDATMSLGALARRGGLRGDVAGVAIRSMAGKIVSPTRDGIAALNAAGIKYSDYVHMPDSLSTDALEGQFQNKLGKGFTPEIRKKLDAINKNKDIIGDSGKYTHAVTEAVVDILGKTKDGTVRASDSAKAAKAAFGFHKLSAETVDAEGLLDAAMSKNMTLPQLNAWLTDKHGGKGAITQRQWEEFRASREQIKKAGDDPGLSKRLADEMFAGLGGAVENLKGSFENLKLWIGNVNAPLVKAGADVLGNTIDSATKLPEPVAQSLTLGTMAATTLASMWGTMKLARLALGLGGGSAAAAGAGAGASAGAGVAAGAGAAVAAEGGAATAAVGGALVGPLTLALSTAAAAAFAGYATAKVMPKIAETHGPGGIDAATGGTLGESPMSGFAPDRPYVQDWWRRTMPTWAGGDTPPVPAARPSPRNQLWNEGGSGDALPVPPTMAGAAPKVDPSAAADLGVKLGEIKARADALNAQPIAPKADTSGFDALGTMIDVAKTKAGEVNALTISPQVNTGNIGTLIQQLQTVAGLISQINAGVAGLRMPSASSGGGTSSGRVAAAVAGNHSE